MPRGGVISMKVFPLNKGGKKAEPSGGCRGRIWGGRPDNTLALCAAPFVKGGILCSPPGSQVESQTEFLVRLSHFAQTLVVCCHFHPVATHTHAAPAPAVILGGVIEEQNARRVLAFFDESQIGVAKQIAG